MNRFSQIHFHEIINRFESVAPVMVIGDICLDKYTYGVVDRISPEAPVPVLEVTKEWFKLGMASNVSDNLRGLGVKSTLCGVTGVDVHASTMLKLMKENDISGAGIVSDPDRPTTLKERIVTNTQQVCRVDYESHNPVSESTKKKFLKRVEELLPTHSALVIEDYGKGVITQELSELFIRMFKAAGKLVAVDPSRHTPPEWYKGATLLKPNRAEAQIMANVLGYPNEKKIETLASVLVDKLEVEKLIITLGPDGMAMIDTKGPGVLELIPTVANEVFDVSGAGDTAISAITAAMVAGATLEEAAWIGNCASGVVVGKKGTANVSVPELLEFHRHLMEKFAKTMT